MQVNTYRHFKKEDEIFMGLGLWTLAKIALTLITLFIVAQSFQLSLNSFLFLVLAMFTMIIISFIIKASQDNEVEGYYSSLVTHPFENHVFNLFKSPEGHTGFAELLDLATIQPGYILSKYQDLIAVIKLDSGISFYKYDNQDRAQLLNDWGNFLAQISSINHLDSYLSTGQYQNDSIQLFIKSKRLEANPYQSTSSLEPSVQLADLIHEAWYQQETNTKEFIQDQEFYIILRQSNLKTNTLAYRLAAKLQIADKIFSNLDEELNKQSKILDEKIKSLESFFLKHKIKAQKLINTDLETFVTNYIPKEYFSKTDSSFSLLDSSKYLALNNKYYKTYRLAQLPESGELDFWIINYIKRLNMQATASIQFSARNANQDRRSADQKASIIKDFNKKSRSSSEILIRDNHKLAAELMEKSVSFDLSFLVTIEAQSLREIQDFDNQMKLAYKGSFMASLDRQQVENYIYSLPFAFNKLNNSSQLYSTLNLASVTFPFVKSQLGTKAGIYVARELESKRYIYLNEYDRSVFNNRGFNFIGDSGSGKTVAAKVLIKRNLVDQDRRFFIIDNTADGWKFFVDYFNGKTITLDKPELAYGKALFAPFVFDRNTIEAAELENKFNEHLEDLIELLSFVANKHKSLSQAEKTFLTKHLRALYQNNQNPSLSDFYDYLSDIDSPVAISWQEYISPYCYVTNGIYAQLLDDKEASIDDRQIILFTFAKVSNDSNYQATSLHLVNNFVCRKVLRDKLSKITLVVDEAWKLLADPNAKGQELLAYLARAGRGLDLGLWTISQKPSDLPAEIHSSASCSFCFQLKETSDKNEMMRYAGLKTNERELLDNYALYDSGIALFKTTRSSDLIQIKLDPLEEILCNSTRAFSNKRSEIFNKYLKANFSRDASALMTTKELLSE